MVSGICLSIISQRCSIGLRFGDLGDQVLTPETHSCAGCIILLTEAKAIREYSFYERVGAFSKGWGVSMGTLTNPYTYPYIPASNTSMFRTKSSLERDDQCHSLHLSVVIMLYLQIWFNCAVTVKIKFSQTHLWARQLIGTVGLPFMWFLLPLNNMFS